MTPLLSVPPADQAMLQILRLLLVPPRLLCHLLAVALQEVAAVLALPAGHLQQLLHVQPPLQPLLFWPVPLLVVLLLLLLGLGRG